jgi:site-specific DNA-cytosine methylase
VDGVIIRQNAQALERLRMAVDGSLVAGRLVPRIYPVSGRADIHQFLLASIRRCRGTVLYASSPMRVPLYLGLEDSSQQRLGLMIYPFRMTRLRTRNRPSDEIRGQLRYGAEETWPARVLREAQPRRFILENVYALTYNNQASRGSYERLWREIGEAGYDYRAKVLNAADYGVPQSRPRLFVIGARKGDALPDHPEPSHGGNWDRRTTGNPERPHVTSGEALDGLIADPEPEEIMRGQYGHLLADIPPCDNYLHYTAQRGYPSPLFEWRGRFWSFLLKLDPDRPSPTIQAQPGPNIGPFHRDNRRLRLAETKRLFTFPDSFEFVGSRGIAQYMIGNSVPPLLAQRVAEAVRDA